jgi:hypothetical protein
MDETAVFDEADLTKSEEFKDKGNEYFKGKYPSWFLTTIYQ